jgi:sec-independent protein translocase protein TatB
MFEIAWSEILILGVVALIFVGPKDMPVLMRTIGRYAGLIKRQIGDFRAGLDLVLKEADLEETRRELEKVQASVVDVETPEVRTAFDDAVRAACDRRPAARQLEEAPTPLLTAPYAEH